jgi:cation diffusion facilitator CzcD-associated flavoprotein CzcO
LSPFNDFSLIRARYLLAEKAFDRIVIFEQRSSTGGIWNYTPDDTNEHIFTIPQTSPAVEIDEPAWHLESQPGSVETKPIESIPDDAVASFISPIYERLETNIPRALMGFSDLNWPQDSQLFPRHETTLDYIQQYGKDVQDLVRLETQVLAVRPIVKPGSQAQDKWLVRYRNIRTRIDQEEICDVVIVANGHFIVPYIPKIKGLKVWNEKYPGVISHSKYYRKPDDFAGKVCSLCLLLLIPL